MILPFIPKASRWQVEKNIYNKLEDQVLIMQASNYKQASELTKMKSDMKKRYYESTKMRSDISYTNTTITQTMSHKQNYLPENMN